MGKFPNLRYHNHVWTINTNLFVSLNKVLILKCYLLFISDPEADQEASEMLTDNAQNLMQAVSEVLYATEAATIRVPPTEREQLGLKWVKRS